MTLTGNKTKSRFTDETGQLKSWPISFSRMHYLQLMKRLIPAHQTRQAFARTIFCPALQPNACANSGMFESTLSIRKMGNECGLVVTTRRATSGLTLEHQE